MVKAVAVSDTGKMAKDKIKMNKMSKKENEDG